MAPSGTDLDLISSFSKAKAAIHEVACFSVLVKKEQELVLNEDELCALNFYLANVESPPKDQIYGDKFISYKDFKVLSETMFSQKMKKLVNGTSFIRLISKREPDLFGRVPVNLLLKYIRKKNWQQKRRTEFAVEDLGGEGLLSAQSLENFIIDIIPGMLQHLQPGEAEVNNNGTGTVIAEDFYICTVLQTILFFYDPLNKGSVRIVDFLESDFMADLYELQNPMGRHYSTNPSINWFSKVNEMYGKFLSLDTDGNGMLISSELINYPNRSLTQTFIQRLLEETWTSDCDGEIDYRTFIDFALAIDHPMDTASIQYCFRIMDVNHEGYLDSRSMEYFYKDIMDFRVEYGLEVVPFQYVNNEIFDMVQPTNPRKITVRDLIRSEKGDIIIALLTDYHALDNLHEHDRKDDLMEIRKERLALPIRR